jgi:hypothetical protein
LAVGLELLVLQPKASRKRIRDKTFFMGSLSK